jgi:RNA polymerase sigma-70 factor, ECF subfamily
VARKVELEGAGDSDVLTSSSLLARVKIRAPGAWERFVDVYAPLIYRWCRRMGVRADDAPDVLQEVFLAVANHIDQFHRDQPGDTFRGWLSTITRNKIQDYFRSEKHQARACGGSSANERLCRVPDRLPSIAEADPSFADDAALAQRVVELIRPEVEERTWRAFWRLAVDRQPGFDVAAELGMSLRAVYQAKYRVLQRIHQELDDLTQKYPQIRDWATERIRGIQSVSEGNPSPNLPGSRQ